MPGLLALAHGVLAPRRGGARSGVAVNVFTAIERVRELLREQEQHQQRQDALRAEIRRHLREIEEALGTAHLAPRRGRA